MVTLVDLAILEEIGRVTIGVRWKMVVPPIVGAVYMVLGQFFQLLNDGWVLLLSQLILAVSTLDGITVQEGDITITSGSGSLTFSDNSVFNVADGSSLTINEALDYQIIIIP